LIKVSTIFKKTKLLPTGGVAKEKGVKDEEDEVKVVKEGRCHGQGGEDGCPTELT